MFECILAAFRRHFPDLSWWILSVIIACIITAIGGGLLTGGAALPVIAAGCAAVLGITLVGSALYALGRAIWDCI